MNTVAWTMFRRLSPDTYYRERFRYALRFGLRGDLYDDFSYGIRLETSTNPRSPWDTFGSNTRRLVTPSDKSGSGIGIGQAFLNWHPATWFEMTRGPDAHAALYHADGMGFGHQSRRRV